MRYRLEAGALAQPNLSGIGYYTQRLAEALSQTNDIDLDLAYFDFLQTHPLHLTAQTKATTHHLNFPQKVYAKAASFGLAPWFDLFLPKVDVTIFPNFVLWPTCRSQLNGVLVADLTFQKFPAVVEDKNLHHLRRVVPRAIKQADFIITVSEAIKQEIVETYQIEPTRIVVTPIPPPETYAADPGQNDIHTTYTIPTEQYLLFVSTIEPRKNISTLINAYQALPPHIQHNYSLVLAGGIGWQDKTIRQRIEQAKRRGLNIVLTGRFDQRDSVSLYKQASLFIMPSLYEGFGMPVLEAMTIGTPVLLSDIPVFHEVAGQAARYFEPTNSAQLAERIQELLSDPRQTKELVKKGRQNMQRFSWPENIRRIQALVAELTV